MFHVTLNDVSEDAPVTMDLPFTHGTVTSISGELKLFRESGVSVAASLGGSRELCVVAVPSAVGPSDFCTFLGPLISSIEHMRFIRPTGVRGRYAVLLKFSNQAAADRCFRAYNGRAFSSLQPGKTCRALYVSSNTIINTTTDVAAITSSTVNSSTLIELPTCPVCLERLDNSASGLLTTLCQHTFHCACLSAWSDDSCPVCRYVAVGGDDESSSVLSPLSDDTSSEAGGSSNESIVVIGGVGESVVHADNTTNNNANASTSANNSGGATSSAPAAASSIVLERGEIASAGAACDACGLRRDLWMCLVCGTRGCGRYAKQHALAHSVATNHDFSIELATQRVWSYKADGYVHRILQSRDDGKLVALSHHAWPRGGGGGGNDNGNHRHHGTMTRGGGSGVAGRGEDGFIGGGDAGGGGGISPSYRTYDGGVDDKNGGGDVNNNDAGKELARIDAVAFEYTLLLTSQLESQRFYFEAMMGRLLTLAPPERRAEAESIVYAHHGTRASSGGGGGGGSGGGSGGDDQITGAGAARAAATLALTAEVAAARLEALEAKKEAVEARVALAAADVERRMSARRAAAATARADEATEELAFLRDVNDVSAENARQVASTLAAERAARAVDASIAAGRISDLEETVRDLSFALDAGSRIAAGGGALVGGDVMGVGKAPLPTPLTPLELRLKARAAKRAAAAAGEQLD